MRRITVIASALFALPLLAATCITHSQQQQEWGPWVGTVYNAGDAVSESKVRATITDGAGDEYEAVAATCPATLQPREAGTFAVHMPGQEPLGRGWRLTPPHGPVPPFTASLRPESVDHDARTVAADIVVRVLERNLERGYAFVELSNESATDYRGVALCANLRGADGSLADRPLIEVAHARVVSPDLRRGERTTAILYFKPTLAGANAMEFVVRANLDCCATTQLNPDDFRIDSTAIVTDVIGHEHVLVVGRFENTTGADMFNVRLSAHIEGSPADRADDVPVGCGLAAPARERVPAVFLVPLPDGADPGDVTIAGITGLPAQTPSWRALSVSDVRLDGNRVTAVVSNPDERFYNIDGTCFLLYDSHGQLVGAASTFAPGGLDAGESAEVSAIVPSTAAPVRAEVISYAAIAMRAP